MISAVAVLSRPSIARAALVVVLSAAALTSCGIGKQTNCVGTQIEATDVSAVGVSQAQTQLTLRAVFQNKEGEPLPGFEIHFWLISENSNPDECLWAGATTDENGVAERNVTATITSSRTQLEHAVRGTAYRAEYPSFGEVRADGKVYCEASDEAAFSFTPGP